MESIEERVVRSLEKGRCCAQTMVAIGLEVREEENEQLIQASRGLCGGLFRQHDCGTLTGAACFLSLWDSEYTPEMVRDLAKWFQTTYGSTTCAELIGVGKSNKEKCFQLMTGTTEKCMELLNKYEIIKE